MTFSDWKSLNYWLISEQIIKHTERPHIDLLHYGAVIFLCAVKTDVLCFIALVVLLLLN